MREGQEYFPMRVKVSSAMLTAVMLVSSTGASSSALHQQAVPADRKTDQDASLQFDRLRTEGFDAVYNLDYKTARDRFLRMTRIDPGQIGRASCRERV